MKNKIIVTTLAYNYVIRYDFLDKEFVKIVCQVFEIKLQCLIKHKQIWKFDNKVINLIISISIIDIYTKNFTLLLITKLENYLIIFSQL